jgi:hypothetical protein
MAHAFLSPSGAPAWLRCPRKPWLEKDLPDESNDAADEGTCAHLLRDQCLTCSANATEYVGARIGICDGNALWLDEYAESMPRPTTTFELTVDTDMAFNVQKSIDELRELAKGGTLYSEQELDISFITGEEGATGTCDAIIVLPTEIIIDDLKYGHNPVHASSEQLLIYGAAALREYDLLGEIETVRLRVSQPRAEDSEVVYTVVELHSKIAEIRGIAHDIIYNAVDELPIVAGPIQCKYCRVKATCEVNRHYTLGTIIDEFQDLEAMPLVLKKGEIAIGPVEVERVLANAYGVKPAAVTREGTNWIIKKPSLQPQLDAALERITTSQDEDLATLMDVADMIEQTVKAVRAEVERRLLLGTFTDARYKLVEGKKGARKWKDEDEAEKCMKSMRLKVAEMYDLKLKSAPAMEGVLRGNPKKWARLSDYFDQVNGKPSVAHASDKRPALNLSIAEQFAEMPSVADVEDLV